MRIARLIIERFGHLEGAHLHFPDEHGLHVVHGANEAGKTTALTAIGEFLFGIHPQTPFDFLHSYDRLRIGAELVSVGDERLILFRLKRKAPSLRCEADKSHEDAVLTPYLQGVPRSTFETMFGLSARRLRDGGQAIVEGSGDVGQMLYEASGLAGVAGLLKTQRQAADQAYKPSGWVHDFGRARQRRDAADQRIRESATDPAAYATIERRKHELDQRRAERVAELAKLVAERRRVDRIKVTLPHLRAYRDAQNELVGLSGAPVLPIDFGKRHADLASRREVARTKLSTLQERLERTSNAPDDDAAVNGGDARLLAEVDTIETLADESGEVVGSLRDRPDVHAKVRTSAAAIEAGLRALGLDPDIEAAKSRLPTALHRAAVERQVLAVAKLEERHSASQAAHSDALRIAEAAEANHRETAGALAPSDPALDAAIEELRGKALDQELEEASVAVSKREGLLARSLGALPLWPQGAGAAALAAAKLPLQQTMVTAGRQLADALETSRDRTKTVNDARAELAKAKRALDDSNAGDGALAERLARGRAARDAAWSAIRPAYLVGDPPPDDALAVSLDRAIGDTDELTHEAIASAAETGAHRQSLEAFAVRQRALVGAERSETTAREAAHTAAEDWRAIWQPAGICPDSPAAMTTWLQRRETILGQLEQVETASANHAAIAAERSAALVRLEAFAAKPDEPVADRLRRALTVQAGRAKEGARLDASAKEAAAARELVAKTEKAFVAAEAALASWRREWSPLMQTFGLLETAVPEMARDALEHGSAIATADPQWREARERVGLMDATIARATETLDALASRLGETRPVGVALPEVARSYGRRLQEARQHLAKARDAVTARNGLIAEIDLAREALSIVEAEIRALVRIAGVDDEALLADAVRTAAERDAWQAKAEQAELALQEAAPGDSMDAMMKSATGWDHDRATATLDEFDEHRKALTDEAERASAELAITVAEIARAGQGSAAAAAAQERTQAIAEMADAAERWARAHVTATLLEAAVEKFRREQQGPLLARATEHFRTLTGGRYVRLMADTNDRDQKTLYAYTADGKRCASAKLSEGACDQLYLALRVAAIEEQVDGGKKLPFIADDLLASFDDRRAAAALDVLATLGESTQVILFTHHAHIADLARQCSGASVQRMADATG